MLLVFGVAVRQNVAAKPPKKYKKSDCSKNTQNYYKHRIRVADNERDKFRHNSIVYYFYMLGHERAEKIAKWLSGWGFEPLLVGPIAVAVLFFFFVSYDIDAVRAILTALAALSPVWLPLFLLRYGWIYWMHYIRYQNWFSTKHILLEVMLPPEVEKSPLAIEVVLSTMSNSGGEATFIDRIWRGRYRPVWALEIASNEGRVSYYMHMRAAFRNVIEARIYGQFPEAKITEVEDYVAKVPFNLEDYNIWGVEYGKIQAGAVPIKTYPAFNLDKNTDTPEVTVDPISNILEFFSQIGKDEYLWLQIILKARKKDEWYGFYKKGDSFKQGGEEAIKKVIKDAIERITGKEKDDKTKELQTQLKTRGATILTEDEKEKVNAIEKSMGKPIFEAGIRGIYMAKKERFDGSNISPLALLFGVFNTADLNSIVPSPRGLAAFNYPWQDFHDIRKNRIKEELFFHYRHRAYFYVPYDQTAIFLNPEEVATLWHFPNSRVQPPGLERVAAKRAEAPAGLPTGIQ